MELTIKDLAKAGGHRKEVKRMYVEAFAAGERMPFFLMVLMARLPATEFLAFRDGETTVGFVYMATIERLTFVMFLAVEGTLRSRGYGGRILERIAALHPGNKLVVSIERCDVDGPEREGRLRRRRFYAAHGYRRAGYLVELAGQKQEALVRGGEFDPDEFARFFLRYSNHTMRPRLLKMDAEE